jgi:FkbM family methyltransferase
MVTYRPETAMQRWLDALRHLPGPVGRAARRKLARRYGPRAVADFEARMATVGAGDILVDMGANVGDFTERLAATGATVHAWEPDPYAFERLKQRFAGHANVQLHNAAVAAQAGRLRLARKAGFDTDPARHSTASSIVFGDAGKDGIEVEVVSFADALAACGGRAKIVKMDIEGAEFDILTEVFREPQAWPFDVLYVETHERQAIDRIPLIDSLRARAETIAHPVINLYWP